MGIIGSFQGYVDEILFIYNKGNWSNISTIGMNGAVQTNYDSTPCLSLERYSAVTNATVSLQNYNYLKATVYAYNSWAIHVTLGVKSSQNDPYSAISESVIDKNRWVTVICNVSELSNFRYISIEIYAQKSNTIQECIPACISQIYLSKT